MSLVDKRFKAVRSSNKTQLLKKGVINVGSYGVSKYKKDAEVGDAFSITGTITGPIIQGVTVYILNSNTRQVLASGISDSLGNYSVPNLAIGISYDVLPMVEAHTFNPHLAQVTLTTADVVVDFVSIANSQYLFDETTISIVDDSNNRLWETV